MCREETGAESMKGLLISDESRAQEGRTHSGEQGGVGVDKGGVGGSKLLGEKGWS